MAETRVPSFLDFEKPIAELEGKIEELRHLSDDGGISIADEVENFRRVSTNNFPTLTQDCLPGRKSR